MTKKVIEMERVIVERKLIMREVMEITKSESGCLKGGSGAP
jgi:hypothetical protein